MGALATIGVAGVASADSARGEFGGATAELDPLGEVSVGGAAEAVTSDDGRTAYVSTDAGFVSVDISDPSSPSVMATREDTGVTGIKDVKVDGDRVIVQGPANRAGSTNGFGLYDVSDPSSPQRLAFFDTDYAIHNAFLSDGIAWLIDNGAAEMVVVDVSDDDPTEIGRWGLSGASILHDLWVQDGRAYLNYWDDGTVILDVSTPSNPESIAKVRDGSGRSPNNDHYVMVDDDASLIAIGKEAIGSGTNLGVELWDISDPTDTSFLAEIDPPSQGSERTSHNFDLVGDYLYTSWYEGGVRVHDVSDPANPEQIASYRNDTASFWTAKVAVRGEVVVASDFGGGGLYTFTDPRDDGGGGNQPPTASFEAPGTVQVGADATFDASNSADPDGSIASYDWAFGDGTAGSGVTTTTSYDSPGDYTVELTVTDDAGASATASRTVTVESGGGGECGRVETTTRTGTLDGRGDGDTSTYAAKTADPCSLTLDLSGDPGTDFDLYLTLDGRTPTTGDYDRRGFTYGSDELIEVEGDVIPADPTVGILVNAYSGSGDYTLEIEEVGGEGSDDPEPEPNEPPEAALTADPTTVTAGDPVTFDATPSSDADGSIERYEWALGDGTDATGRTLSHTYTDPGEYAVELTVTDDDGATDSATRTITVEPGDGGECGDATAGEQYEGTLFSFFGGNSYTYEPDTADSCRVTVTLDGPTGGNFDLYVTTDGRTPTPDDFDRRSASPDSQEEVSLVDDGDVSGPIGILVEPASGFGQYTLDVEEIGR